MTTPTSVPAMIFLAGLAVSGLGDRPRGVRDLRERPQEVTRTETGSQDASSTAQDASRAATVPRIEVTGVRESPQEVSSGRSSRRRVRYRYPGPIPTPAEWEPPAGPVRIALQAGHWRANEAPRELSGLKDNGTAWRGTPEWRVTLGIARSAGALLEELGYEVDILPAVVPPGYRAHLFIAIHADGSNDSRASGFRVSGPRRDATGRASGFVELLKNSYQKETGLRRLPDATRRMQNYYAFNFRRYEHALHPMTIAVIIETGFLTSPRDRGVIMDDPARAARGIVEAVIAYSVTPPPSGTPSPPPPPGAPSAASSH